MNKIIFRVIALVALFEILIFNFNWNSGMAFFNNTNMGRICNIITGVGVIYLWAYMFYHWGTNNFSKKIYKIFWFWSMIIGLFFGAFIYYLIVYELRQTLQEDNGKEKIRENGVTY
jgi:hypothetical protein